MYRRRTRSLPTLINSKPQAPLANWSIAYFTTSGEKCIVWEGAGDQSPTLSELSAIPTDLQPTQLIVIAIEVLKNAPLESLGVLLQILSSFYCRNADNKIDVEILASKESKTAVCGCIFKKGDIVWTCRQCAKDVTCVQCDPCFRKSDHKGHDVFFHRSSGDSSGCCDCGDAEAWAAGGNCSDHNGRQSQGANLNPNIEKGLEAVARAIAGVITSFAVSTVRGFQPWNENPFVQAASATATTTATNTKANILVGRLHNDDIHTYDEVIRALFSTRIVDRPRCEALTYQVDKEGEAIVCSSASESMESLQKAANLLSGNDHKLLFSVTPQEVVDFQPRMIAALNFVIAIGTTNDVLCSLIVKCLMAESSELLPLSIDPLSSLCETSLQMTSASLRLPSQRSLFPYSIPQLQSLRFQNLSLNKPAFATPLASPEEHGRQFLHHLIHPFDSCECNTLGVLILASCFFPKAIKKLFNELVIKFQHDIIFKYGFSQLLTVLYPTLYGLYFRHIGTEELSIFGMSVQLYTANSIVALMSNEAVASRPLTEHSPILIARMLTSTLLVLMHASGCEASESVTTVKSNTAFLSHHSIRTRRIANLCRDVEYITTNTMYSCRLLCEEVEAGVIDDWIEACARLQYIDSHKREITRHVEIESEHWEAALNLILELGAVSQTFLSRALFSFDDFDPSSSSKSSALSFTLPLPAPNALKSALRSPGAVLNTADYVISEVDNRSMHDISAMRRKAVFNCIDKALKKIYQCCSKQATIEDLTQNLAQAATDEDLPFFGRIHLQSEVGQYVYTVKLWDYVLSLPRSFFSVQNISSPKHFASIHIELHRFVAKVAMLAAFGNVSLEDVFSEWRQIIPIVSKKQIPAMEAVLFLADYPARCLSFASQALAGLWVRNGGPVRNIAYNYSVPPLSQSLRSLDIVALQLAMVLAPSPEVVVMMIAHRFELTSYLDDPVDLYAAGRIPQQERAFKPPLLSEMLRLLIHIVMHPPTSLANVDSASADARSHAQYNEGLRRALLRELVHQVLGVKAKAGSVVSIGQVMEKSKRLVAMGGGASSGGISDGLSNAVIAEAIESPTSDCSEGRQSTTTSLNLKASSYLYYDPEYPHLNFEESNQAAEKMKLRFRNSPLSGPNDFRALFNREAIVAPNYDFRDIRSVLYKPLTFDLLHMCLRLCTSDFKTNRAEVMMIQDLMQQRLVILRRIFYLITLQIYLASDIGTPSICKGYFTESFFAPSESNPSSSGKGFAFLKSLTSIWKSDLLDSEAEMKSALGWILQQLTEKSVHARGFLESQEIFLSITSQGSPVSRSPGHTESAQAKDVKRFNAQKKALELANARAKAFAAFASEFGDDSDPEDEQAKEQTGKMNTVTDPETSVKGEVGLLFGSEELFSTEDECLICRGQGTETDGLSVLCFLQPSRVLKNLIQSDANTSIPLLNSVYRVVKGDCVVYKDMLESSSLLTLLQLGTHVLAKERIGAWVRISAPVNGWCQVYTQPKGSSQSKSTVAENNGGKDLHVYLHPVSDLQWLRHGSTRTHVSSCGHATHRSCWEAFYASEDNLTNRTEHVALNLSAGEILCPFCKTISNAILPKSSSPSFAPQSSLTEKLNLTLKENFLQTTINSILTGKIHVTDFFSLDPIESESSKGSQLQDTFLVRCLSQSCQVDGLPEDKSSLSLTSVLDSIEKRLSRCDISNAHFHFEIQYVCATWAAIAYTLLTSTVNQIRARHPDSDMNASGLISSQLSKSDQIVLYHGIQHLRSTRFVFDTRKKDDSKLGESFDPTTYYNIIAQPLFAALFGSHSTSATSTRSSASWASSSSEPVEYVPLAISKSDLETRKYGLQALPHRSLWSSHETAVISLEKTQKLLLDGLKTAKDATLADVDQVLFPVLQSPLISQDLHVFAVALTSAAADLRSYGIVSATICFARLVQALLEPSCTGQGSLKVTEQEASSPGSQQGNPKRAKSSPDSELKGFKYIEIDEGKENDMLTSAQQLLLLLRLVISETGVPFNDTITALDVLDNALDSWIPFLEFSYHLKSVMLTFTVQSSTASYVDEVRNMKSNGTGEFCCPSSDTRSKLRHTLFLCKALGIPSLHELSSQDCWRELARIWCAHYKTFFGSSQGGDRVNFIPSLDKDFSECNLKGSSNDDHVESTLSKLSGKATERQHIDSLDDSSEMLASANLEAAMEDEYTLLAMSFRFLRGENSGGIINNSQMGRTNEDSVFSGKKWKLVGVDPTYPRVDFDTSHNVLFIESGDKHVERKRPIVKVVLTSTVSGATGIVDYNGRLLVNPYPDLSHMGFGLRNIKGPLIALPYLYIDLYQKAKFGEGLTVDDPALCLVCGRVVNAGNRMKDSDESCFNPGECTLHARKCSGGVSLFYLVQHFTLLLVRDSRCCFYPPQASLYLDANGESKLQSQNRPMYLSAKRFKDAENLYLSHSIAKEVVRKRSTEDRYIRQFFY